MEFCNPASSSQAEKFRKLRADQSCEDVARRQFEVFKMAEISDDDRDVPASTVPLMNDDRDDSGDEQDSVVSSMSSEKAKTNILTKISFLHIVCFTAMLATGITCAYAIHYFYGKNNFEPTKNPTPIKNTKHEFIGATEIPTETASAGVKVEDEIFKNNNVGTANSPEKSSALIQETVVSQSSDDAAQAQQHEVAPEASNPPQVETPAETGQASQQAVPSESNAASPAESEEDLKKRQSMLTIFGGLEKVCASMRAAQILDVLQWYHSFM